MADPSDDDRLIARIRERAKRNARERAKAKADETPPETDEERHKRIMRTPEAWTTLS